MSSTLIISPSSPLRRRIAAAVAMSEASQGRSVSDAEGAAELCRLNPPTVVVLDVTVGEQPARAFLARLFECAPDARVVLCATMAQLPEVGRLLTAGAADAVLAPFAPDALARKLARRAAASAPQGGTI